MHLRGRQGFWNELQQLGRSRTPHCRGQSEARSFSLPSTPPHFHTPQDEQTAVQMATQACGFATIVSGTFLLHATKDLDLSGIVGADSTSSLRDADGVASGGALPAGGGGVGGVRLVRGRRPAASMVAGGGGGGGGGLELSTKTGGALEGITVMGAGGQQLGDKGGGAGGAGGGLVAGGGEDEQRPLLSGSGAAGGTGSALGVRKPQRPLGLFGL